MESEDARNETDASGAEAAVGKSGSDEVSIAHGTIQRVERRGAVVVCRDEAGSEHELPVAADPCAGDALLARKTGCVLEEFLLLRADRRPTVYFAAIGYARQPKETARGSVSVKVEIRESCANLRAIELPSSVLRDYFYVADRRRPFRNQPSLYAALGVGETVAPLELALAFRLRRLEAVQRGDRRGLATWERVYNLLALPPLRAHYDELRRSPKAAVAFPGAGFGTLLVEGNWYGASGVFYASRILTYRAEHRRETLSFLFRKLDFFEGLATYHDGRRRREIFLNAGDLPQWTWDASWNQWKSYVGGKVTVTAEFWRTGRYRRQRGEDWAYDDWRTAFPSRLEAVPAEDLGSHIEQARERYRRESGFRAETIFLERELVAKKATEGGMLEDLCWDLGLPVGFEVAHINWKPDYDDRYYQRLKGRAVRVYLYKKEYIFELERHLVLEIPKSGTASYLFHKPQLVAAGTVETETPITVREWLRVYRGVSRQAIRLNVGGIGERLGFLGRVSHGRRFEQWWDNLLLRLGESAVPFPK